MKFAALAAAVIGAALCTGVAYGDGESPGGTYLFGESSAMKGTIVQPGDAYSADKGYGFDLGSTPRIEGGAASAGDKRAFLFSVKVHPGVYEVSVTLGGPAAAETTIKSETRRLMKEKVKTGPGAEQVVKFLAHVRVPQIPEAQGGGVVKFKPRESDPILFVQWDLKDGKALIPFTELDWDEKLTLEFAGDEGLPAAVKSVSIKPASDHTTLFLVGDSTMTDQMMEPYTAWGQQLPRFFKEPVVIANYAECGETIASFIGEKRWPKVLSEVKKGDYVFIQFGINDQAMGVQRFKGYFPGVIDDVQKLGGIPVLVTSQNLQNRGLGEFPQAMRDVATDKGVPLIDLNAMSEKLYAAEGPDLGKLFIDGTHHSEYGAYELCKCVVQGIKDIKLPVAQFITDDFTGFDPTHPDPVDKFIMPLDPQLDPARKGGPGAPNGQGPMAAPKAAPRAGRSAGPVPAATAPATTVPAK